MSSWLFRGHHLCEDVVYRENLGGGGVWTDTVVESVVVWQSIGKEGADMVGLTMVL
jgi:hypothetical protein